MDLKQLIFALYDIGCIKIGDFTLASGMKSPIYIDLRPIVSHPSLMKMVAEALWAKISSLQAELLCGIPYNALPIATCMSLTKNVPMVMVRKELKQHGTKREVEGVFPERPKLCLDRRFSDNGW